MLFGSEQYLAARAADDHYYEAHKVEEPVDATAAQVKPNVVMPRSNLCARAPLRQKRKDKEIRWDHLFRDEP